jgi:hypothetical protein
MVNVKSQIDLLESSMDCFYSLRACSSAIEPSMEGKPPRDNIKKKIGTTSTKKSRRKGQEEREIHPPNRRERSRSKPRERGALKNATATKVEQPVKKRVGAAYQRSNDSIVTKETSTFFSAERGLTDTINRSEDTFTTNSVSASSSSEGISCSSDSNETPKQTEESLTARLRNSLADNRSISTEDVEKKPHNSTFSWFLMSKTETQTPAPQSPSDSVGAVKKSIRSKFDYIRKSQKFANPFPDPPSDQSMMTSHSIIADEAGSLLKRGYRYNISKRTELQARKNELVKQILKQRQAISRPGFDP